MRHHIHSLIASTLFITVITTGVFAYLPIKAHAQGGTETVLGACGLGFATDFLSSKAGDAAGSVTSISVPVNDTGTQTTIAKSGLQQCLMTILNITIKVALAKMKKRLLDKLTDDTIAWIRGDSGNSPQFVTNFGDVLTETADAALGDALQASGLGKLCTERLSFQLQLSLRKERKFSEGVTCTLSGAAKNVTSFADNFDSGGWIGFGQLLEPSNNPWGLEAMAKEAFDIKLAANMQEMQMENMSGGYRSTKMCAKWTLKGVNIADGRYTDITTIEAKDFAAKYRAPNDPPPPDEWPTGNYPDGFPSRFSNLKYYCKAENQIITTPSSVLSASTNKALTSDWDTIANSDDLTPYISAIFDAATNRLKKEAVKGLLAASDDIFSRNSRGQDPEKSNDQTYIDNNKRDAGDIGGAGTKEIAELKNIIKDTRGELTEAQSLYQTAKQRNDNLSITINKLGECQTDNMRLIDPFVYKDFNGCPGLGTERDKVNPITTQLYSISSNLGAIEVSLTAIDTQLSKAEGLTLVEVATFKSSITSLRSGIASAKADIENNANAIVPIETRITDEMNKCSLSRQSHSTYMCPVWQ